LLTAGLASLKLIAAALSKDLFDWSKADRSPVPAWD
jgi:hypothetical protein